MIVWRRVILGSILFGAGLGIGLVFSIAYKPAIIVEEKWRTVTTAPTPPVVLGHTSLNEDELRTLLTIMDEPKTTTTIAPSTTSTVDAPVTQTTKMPLPPSTQPPSSTTLPPETTTTTMVPTTATTVAPTTTSPPETSSTTTTIPHE